jgi:hypothetical protein
MNFQWDKANRAHIAEHGIAPEEAEQVLRNSPLDLEVQTRSGEERTIQLGETNGGRVLIVVSTWRGEKLRIVTAFPANRKMRTLYAKYQGKV